MGVQRDSGTDCGHVGLFAVKADNVYKQTGLCRQRRLGVFSIKEDIYAAFFYINFLALASLQC